MKYLEQSFDINNEKPINVPIYNLINCVVIPNCSDTIGYYDNFTTPKIDYLKKSLLDIMLL